MPAGSTHRVFSIITPSSLPFWVDWLAAALRCIGLPLDKPRPAHQDSGGGLVFSTIEKDLWSFKRLCHASHSTSNFIGRPVCLADGAPERRERW